METITLHIGLSMSKRK